LWSHVLHSSHVLKFHALNCALHPVSAPCPGACPEPTRACTLKSNFLAAHRETKAGELENFDLSIKCGQNVRNYGSHRPIKGPWA
jgi:hypothetical protein